MKQKITNAFDVIVVGGGHAGIEAALASARMGMTACLITIDKLSIGRMSCNPAIGGLAKGHLVREIDALGGEMGLAADKNGIQFRVLNKSKGRAVWSPRAQIDKKQYEAYMQRIVLRHPLISFVEDEVKHVLIKHYSVEGIKLKSGVIVLSKTVIITAGTFLNGLIHIGRRKISAGRMGEENSDGITESLVSHGFKAGRLKTGTTPRMFKQSIDFHKLDIIDGDQLPVQFSFRTQNFSPPNIPCFLARTNNLTHEIIGESLHESPLFSGEIKGIGPRYCPSIEDKVVRFSDKGSHQLFLEPEWINSEQYYSNGFSTSLPETTQLKAIRSINGLNRAVFIRPGYAIEYDFFYPSQLKSSLETKDVAGLFLAGQINGTSGYEEAAAQGIVAGINASLFCKQIPPVILRRDQAYIGVLIDDLVTKDTLEPYRMFTSRAEYRLILRYATADRRLFEIGNKIGLISNEWSDACIDKYKKIDRAVDALRKTRVDAESLIWTSPSRGRDAISLAKLLMRPGCSIESVLPFLRDDSILGGLSLEAIKEVESIVKYDGYVEKQLDNIKFLSDNENQLIPLNFSYGSIVGLSTEGREKLLNIRPETLGQAIRISGVTPSDVSVLAVYLRS